MPSERTFRRRLDTIEPGVVLLKRDGPEALRQSIPAQRRTVDHLHALEHVNVDGHRFDVFVKDAEGRVFRPTMVAIQDISSSKIVGWRLGETESAVLTRLAFADVFRDFGIPKHCTLDNGRAFASKWITGGAKTRYRFKIREEEPTGLLTGLGIEIHWATPYRGQSKPIERAFRDMCDRIAKHPAMEGAYTGNSPMAKPDNYGSRAIPMDDFVVHVAQGIAAHNARLGRRGRNYAGRSFDQVFAESYAAAPIGTGIAIITVMLGITLAWGRAVSPASEPRPLLIGAAGLALGLVVDILFIGPLTTPGLTVVLMAVPWVLALYGATHAAKRLAGNELIRVVFPPLVLIVAVLGSILGGITNPTPAAALGAAGAIMLAAWRRMSEEGRDPWIILWSTYALAAMLLIGINFDVRINVSTVGAVTWIAFLAAYGAFLFALFGLLYACWVLLRARVLTPAVRETAKVTSMVFTILVASQLLNLVVISFGGEHYIQQFLQSFDNELKVFLIVMIVLFVLGFVLDFLEIIYIVVPIVGPVIYGGSFDPKWVTIMIAVNLQTSFLTPPFGFALFYLRGVAPAEVTTAHIYRGVFPFVLIQVLALVILWVFPGIVTIVPDLMP